MWGTNPHELSIEDNRDANTHCKAMLASGTFAETPEVHAAGDILGVLRIRAPWEETLTRLAPGTAPAYTVAFVARNPPRGRGRTAAQAESYIRAGHYQSLHKH